MTVHNRGSESRRGAEEWCQAVLQHGGTVLAVSFVPEYVARAEPSDLQEGEMLVAAIMPAVWVVFFSTPDANVMLEIELERQRLQVERDKLR